MIQEMFMIPPSSSTALEYTRYLGSQQALESIGRELYYQLLNSPRACLPPCPLQFRAGRRKPQKKGC